MLFAFNCCSPPAAFNCCRCSPSTDTGHLKGACQKLESWWSQPHDFRKCPSPLCTGVEKKPPVPAAAAQQAAEASDLAAAAAAAAAAGGYATASSSSVWSKAAGRNTIHSRSSPVTAGASRPCFSLGQHRATVDVDGTVALPALVSLSLQWRGRPVLGVVVVHALDQMQAEDYIYNRLVERQAEASTNTVSLFAVCLGS